MRPTATDGVAWSVCVSVGHDRGPAKTDRDAVRELRHGLAGAQRTVREGFEGSPELELKIGTFEGKF